MAFKKRSIDLEYILTDVQFEIEFQEDTFTDEEKNELTEFIHKMSKSMPIDRSYVECAENKRSSAFMLESGWDSLQEVVLDSEFCKHLNWQAKEVLVDSFATMARCYMYECLALKTDKYAEIALELKKDSTFDIIVCKDTAQDYKKYIGKWQDWEFDDNGKFLSSNLDNGNDESK